MIARDVENSWHFFREPKTPATTISRVWQTLDEIAFSPLPPHCSSAFFSSDLKFSSKSSTREPNQKMPQQHTFYNYSRDPPKAPGRHNRYIREGQHFPSLPSSPSFSFYSNWSFPHTDVGGARYIDIPERCPCQDEPQLATRQPLRSETHEEQFWRNLHIFTGLRTQKSAFEMDEKARRDENQKVGLGISYTVVVGKDCDGQEDGRNGEEKWSPLSRELSL